MTVVAGFYSLGLVGYPIQHSRSPDLHRAALAAVGLVGEYRLYPVSPHPLALEELRQLFDRLRVGGITGLNVTLPYKSVVIPLLDRLTQAAAAIGAVNTVWDEDGVLTGDNTDAPGVLVDLDRVFPDLPDGYSALVLGAGGAARGICWALHQSGVQVIVAARRVEQAEALVKNADLGYPALIPLSRDGLGGLANIQLVVNATSVGMNPDLDESPWPVGVPLPAGAAVYDLVVRPEGTPLVRRAQAAGHLAAGGLGMLVEQAALSFERWTGCHVPRPALWAAVEGSP